DDIFAGHAVGMHSLVVLFGRDRHLLVKLTGARIKKGRKTRYDYRTVTAIMDALLSERPRKRKAQREGDRHESRGSVILLLPPIGVPLMPSGMSGTIAERSGGSCASRFGLACSPESKHG